ncbi:hypothetical protein ACFL35_02725, partial [Candidatus Riflebacteria bacterium]
LEQAMKDLMKDPKLKEELQKLTKGQDFKKMQEEFKKALKALRKNNPGMARKPEDQLLRMLLKTEEKVTKTVELARNKEGQQILFDIMGMVRNGIEISLKQEEINTGLQKFPDKFMRGKLPSIEGKIETYTEEEEIVALNLKDLGKMYEGLTKKIPQMPPSLLRKIGRSEKILYEVRKDLEDRAIKVSRVKGRNVVALVNEFVLALLKMQQQQQQGGGTGNQMDRFRNLTRRQRNLNRHSQQLRRRMANQKILNESVKEHMQRMAMEQEQIAKEMKELAEKMKKTESGLNRMGELSKKMEELKQELEKVNNDERLKRKQNKLLEHMLDSERALKTKNAEGKKRKAEIAKKYAPAKVKKVPLPEHLKNKKYLGHWQDRGKEYIAPDFKKDIEEYYRNLSVFTREEE